MNRDLEDRIAAMAVRQHGIVTREQLMRAGLSRGAVSRRLSSGRLRQLHRGVYLLGPLMLPRTREMAAVLASGTTALISHLSSSAAYGMIPQRPTAEPVDITVVGVNCGRRPGIRLHRVARLGLDERTAIDGVPSTSPLRTIADIAGILGSRELEGAVARAEREGLVTSDELAVLAGRLAGRPGAATLRAVLDTNGGPALTRSEAESRFLTLVRSAGLPAPETNVQVGSYEIDFLWRNECIAVEIDGYRYHASRPRFESDRRKDAWLLARGIKVIRLSWHQITKNGTATAVQVAQALALAAHARR